MDPQPAVKAGAPVSTRILSMDDPAAWRESYSAASPRELDSQQVLSPKEPRNDCDTALRGGLFNKSPVSELSSHTEFRMAASSNSLGGMSSIAGEKGGEEEAVRDSVERHARWSIPRKSLPQVAELPG